MVQDEPETFVSVGRGCYSDLMFVFTAYLGEIHRVQVLLPLFFSLYCQKVFLFLTEIFIVEIEIGRKKVGV